MASALRQRNPFNFAPDIPDIDGDGPDHVLDEQEQEAVIEQLQKENAKISQRYVIAGVIVVSLSAMAQLFVLLGAWGSAGSLQRDLALSYLALHAQAVLLLQQKRTIAIGNNATISIPPFLPIQFTTLFGPLFALLFPQNIEPLLVIMPLVATVLAWMCLGAVEDGAKGLAELEKLKYTAKGA